MKKAALLMALCCFGLCCGRENAPQSPQPAGQPQPTVESREAAPPAEPEGGEQAQAPQEITATAKVRIVDLAGRPLEGIAPIAVAQPNAFEKPVYTGPLTDEEGRSTITLMTDQWLYVRGWDPNLRMFSNNYYDVPPGQGTIAEELVLIMVDGAAIQMQLVTPDGGYLANSGIEVMLHHPEKGPWWPASAITDAQGIAIVTPVPAGEYRLTIRSEKGTIELPVVPLPPSEQTDLGAIRLQ